MAVTTGDVLNDRYRIDAVLGQGGMGAVYRGTDLTFNTQVAIKENLEVTAEAERQFGREASILHELRHPNLPRVTDHFLSAGQGQYLVMDYIDGEDLDQMLAREGPLPENQVLGWIEQVLDALEYLHSQDIVHRDVKPANIKITSEGEVFLVDFGLAKEYEQQKETTIGARGATPGFAPPEQYGHGLTDYRSDIFSVGATLYALLTCTTPPPAPDTVTGQVKLIPPREVNPNVSPHVEAAVIRAMQIRPDDRFQTVDEFRMALAQAEPVPTSLQQPVLVEPRQTARPTWVWVALVSAVVLVVTTVGLGLMLASKAPPTSSAPGSQKGIDYFQQGNEHFQKGSEHAMAANEYSQAGESEKAESEYDAAQAEFDRALEKYDAVLAEEPENVSALVNSGIVYYTKGELATAIAQYQRAVELAPNDADIHSNLAAAFVQSQRLEDALAEYELAVELEPELAEAHFGLGVVYLQTDQRQKSILAFERFLELDEGRDPMASEQATRYLKELKGQ